MPKKGAFKRKWKRKTTKAKTIAKVAKVVKAISKGKGVKTFPYKLNYTFAPRLFKKLTYTETVKLPSSTAGNLSGGAAQFRLNSPFDPNFGGTGHQPLYYDEIKALGYQRCLVHGCLVEVTFTDPSSDGMYYGLSIDTPANNDSIASVYHDYLKEYPRCIVGYVNGTGSQKAVLKYYVHNHKVCNVSKTRYNTDPDYASLVTTYPQKSPLLNLVCGMIDPNNTAQEYLIATVKLTLYTEFFDSDNYPSPS